MPSKDISIEAKKIKVIKDWPKPKSVYNIEVFPGFANFNWQFILSFSRITALFTSILQTTESSDKLAPSRNDSSKLVSNRNNGNKIAFKRNNGNSKIKVDSNNIEYAKKLEKLKS